MLPQGLVPNLMLLGGMALLAMILFRRLYQRSRGKGKKRTEEVSFPREPSSPLIDAPPELKRWQVEMHEVARELRAELDTKAVMVQTLIGMLREEIDRLDNVLARDAGTGSIRAVEPLDPELLAEIKRLSAEITAGSGVSHAKAGSAIKRLDQSVGPGIANATDAGRVHTLAAQGMLPSEIAELLALEERDVELLLSMRK